MNGTERNILAFAYAKNLVRFFGDRVEGPYGVLAPRRFVIGLYEAQKDRVPTDRYKACLPFLSMEADEGPEMYRYWFSDRTMSAWLVTCTIAAVQLWRHRFQRDIDLGDRLDGRTTLAVLTAADRLKPGGSPHANAARVIGDVQRQWRAYRAAHATGARP